MSFKKVFISVLAVLFFGVSVVYADEAKHVGIVTEAFHAGNYTYIKLAEEGKEVWLASQPMDVSAGEKIEYIGGVPQKNFHSKTLGRSFEDIIFITRIKVMNRDSEKEKIEASDDESNGGTPKKAESASMPVSGEIKRAENGKTVHEIFSEAEQLKDKEVILRAKVIKINTNILGKNWVTLSDGTGTKPDNKIIATTMDDAEPGDILTVIGTVKDNVSIGQGYTYKVMIGNAKFTK
jgi:hypothetical protein